MEYQRNIVPKIYSGMNLREQIARGYIHYLKGKVLCHNIIIEGVDDDETSKRKLPKDKRRNIAVEEPHPDPSFSSCF